MQTTHPTKLHQNKRWFKLRGKNNLNRRTSQGRAESQQPQHKQTNNNNVMIIIIVSLLWEH